MTPTPPDRDDPRLRRSEERAHRASERMRAIADAASGIVGAHDLDTLQDVLRAACERVMEFDIFVFALYHPEEDTLTFLRLEDAGELVDRYPGVPLAGTPTERVIRERQSSVSRSFEAYEERGAQVIGSGGPAESIIRTPILAAERALGVLSVQSYARDLYVAEDVEVLESLAALAATALLNIEFLEERHRAEGRLRESEERYRLMVEGSEQVFFYAYGPDGGIQYVSPSVENLLGYTPNELIGVGFTELMTGSSTKEAIETAAPALRGGNAPAPYAVMARHKEGEQVPIELVESPLIRDGETVGVHGFARDIRERRRAEAALRKSEEQLQQAQKMEAIGRLAGGIAHDFNNLLNVVSGNAEMALLDLPEDSSAREDVEEIRRAADRATGLTRQLLTISRQQVRQPRVIDLNETIEEMGRMFSRVIGEDIDLDVNTSEESCPVFADPGQVEQVLLNLVVNARDAMTGGGRLTISTRVVEGRTAERLGVPEQIGDGRYVHLVVNDTGTGVHAEIRERIFEPFFTTKAQGKGTGLGLASVYGIVRQSSGHLWLESEKGEGASFHILLPRSDAAVNRPAGTPTPVVSAGRETILLVEDEPALRQLARKVLRRAGYHVLEAEIGEEAIRIASAYEDDIHLLLTDVVMPGMNGPEVAEALEGVRPGIPVLYTSGYTDDALLHRGVVEDRVTFLPKPYSPADLTALVRRIIDAAPE